VVDQSLDMTPAQLLERPVSDLTALDFDVENASDPVLIGGVGSLPPRMALRPEREVATD
jgi:hypothetical protein